MKLWADYNWRMLVITQFKIVGPPPFYLKTSRLKCKTHYSYLLFYVGVKAFCLTLREEHKVCVCVWQQGA
jgi:hypothetical protein